MQEHPSVATLIAGGWDRGAAIAWIKQHWDSGYRGDPGVPFLNPYDFYPTQTGAPTPAPQAPPVLVARAAQNEVKQAINELGRFDYGNLLKFPHLSKTDTKVWRQYVFTHPNAYLWADYDETVGLGRTQMVRVHDHDAGRPPDTISAGQTKLTLLRIDVTAFRSETDVDIIEVKGRAMPGAVGEVLVYTRLWTEKHPGVTVRPVIIADNVHPDVHRIAESYGIIVIIV